MGAWSSPSTKDKIECWRKCISPDARHNKEGAAFRNRLTSSNIGEAPRWGGGATS